MHPLADNISRVATKPYVMHHRWDLFNQVYLMCYQN